MNPHRNQPTLLVLPALALCVIALACLTTTSAHAAKKQAPPAKPAAEYPANDAHPNEHVTIAIDPCDSQKDCDFFRLPYVAHSMIPVRVIITNDGDSPLSLSDARFQFISANNDKLPAADLEDLNRRMFTFKSTAPTRIPIIPITIHKTPIDKKVTDDDADFGFQTTTVAPHSTLAGYLFYDIKPLDDPALRDAQIYIKMIYSVDSKTAAKKELFAFTIPFNKWQAAKPRPAPPAKP